MIECNRKEVLTWLFFGFDTVAPCNMTAVAVTASWGLFLSGALAPFSNQTPALWWKYPARGIMQGSFFEPSLLWNRRSSEPMEKIRDLIPPGSYEPGSTKDPRVRVLYHHSPRRPTNRILLLSEWPTIQWILVNYSWTQLSELSHSTCRLFLSSPTSKEFCQLYRQTGRCVKYGS